MVQQNFPAHHSYIAGGGKVSLGVQAAGVLKVGVGQAQLSSAGVHLLHKGGFAAAHKFGHRHSGIVGTGNADGFQHVVQRHLLARLQPDLAAAHVIGMLTDRHSVA